MEPHFAFLVRGKPGIVAYRLSAKFGPLRNIIFWKSSGRGRSTDFTGTRVTRASLSSRLSTFASFACPETKNTLGLPSGSPLLSSFFFSSLPFCSCSRERKSIDLDRSGNAGRKYEARVSSSREKVLAWSYGVAYREKLFHRMFLKFHCP